VRSSQPSRAWPTILWEIQDTGDQDAAGSPGAGFRDMGETWSKPAVGRVRICTANCGNVTTPLPVFEDHDVAIFGGGFDRERQNRRGNWLYMVDVETGKTLYRANSSCGVNAGDGCSPVYFGSVASDPTALDWNGDGILDAVYVGDLKGQMWRVDLTDLRRLASPPAVSPPGWTSPPARASPSSSSRRRSRRTPPPRSIRSITARRPSISATRPAPGPRWGSPSGRETATTSWHGRFPLPWPGRSATTSSWTTTTRQRWRNPICSTSRRRPLPPSRRLPRTAGSWN